MKIKLRFLLQTITLLIPRLLDVMLNFLYLLFLVMYDLNTILISYIKCKFDNSIKSETEEKLTKDPIQHLA